MNKTNLPLVDDFLLNLQSNNYSEETLYNYERDLETFLNFLKENKIEFKNVNKRTILNYKAYLNSLDRKTANKKKTVRKLSSYSVNRILSALRSYIKFLIDMDYDSSISPEMIKLIKTPSKISRVSEFDEIVKLIESPTKFEKNKKIALRNRAILETFFSTGIRISELLNIKLTEIDKNGTIFIHGKGKKERLAYLTPRAQKYVTKYLEIRGNPDSLYLFIPFAGKNLHTKNKKLSANYLQAKIKRYRELLDLNIPVSAHKIRHAYATYLAENGASPAAIQILLGHESLDTTTRYVHVSNKYAEKVQKKFHPLKD
ncbi:tyrosine-type recombinase/integrase [Patescibacteria group bacterium]|nr:tyrosine-type recombinase/integrase [Patescibacteria group bacterium]MBU4022983.1 tyrosine-type recombinase/integrase [Patescibacteria group bacterium]MBU4078078.1 tyrosine-type recombinase/integrase [Patescibacteria group bacterium]